MLLECPPAIRSALEFYDPPLKAGRDPELRLAMRVGLVKRRGSEGVNAEPLALRAMALAFDMEHDCSSCTPCWRIPPKTNTPGFSLPLFHIAYIAIGLGAQQGGQQHRFTLILCLLSHQGESKGDGLLLPNV